MKTLTLNNMDYPLAPYPNAATKREVIHKVVDHLLVIASCAGIAAIVMFLVALA